MRCKDPNCSCQAAVIIHPEPRKIELNLYSPEPYQIRPLHGEGADLDVVFNLIDGAVHIQETIHGPEYSSRYVSWTFSIVLKPKYLQFINLTGLPDNSLQLLFRMRYGDDEIQEAEGGEEKKEEKDNKKGRKILTTERYYGFKAPRKASRLQDGFCRYDWTNNPQSYLELVLPAERIAGWRTAALILKTFGRITAEQWCFMINLPDPPKVAGLDWIMLESEVADEVVEEWRAAIARAKARAKAM